MTSGTRKSGLPAELASLLGGRGLIEILDSLAEAVTIRDASDRILYANRAAITSMGFDSLDELRARPAQDIFSDYEVSDEHGRPLTMEDLPSVRLLAGRPAEPLVMQTTSRETGRRRWSILKAAPLHDPDGQRVATVMIIEDITAEKLAELRDRFLARASKTLMSSLDHQETLSHVAWLAVPELADWCEVDLIDELGERRLAAVAHRDPDRVELAAELARLRPSRPDAGGGAARVLQTGVAELHPHVGVQSLQAATSTQPARFRELLSQLGPHSVIICPLRARGHVVGAMTLINAESRRAFDKRDLSFAEDLASRAAVAVENARLATGRRATAMTLQASLLPARLPTVPGWRLAALYRSGQADEETGVGGDFYDLFETEQGWVVLLGDVTGKGVEAAAMTSLVRHGARFLGRHNPDPEAIFTLIDEALRERDELSLCTALCARLHPNRVVLSVAGHPAPLIVRDDGRVREVRRAGPILGAWSDGSWPPTELSVAPDETLFLYTDGVIDVPGPLIDDGATGVPSHQERFGTERLRRLLAAHAGESPDRLLDALETELASFQEGTALDDRAVLVLRPAAPGEDDRDGAELS